MEKLLNEDFFKEYKDSMIYLERTQNDGKVREGLMGIVDLEGYSYEVGSKTPIRATEKTVIERIPPRVKIRENASRELPHIMILIDDDKKEIIESLKTKVTEEDVVYDFDLMKNGGHIKGYVLNNETMDEIDNQLKNLADQSTFDAKYKNAESKLTIPAEINKDLTDEVRKTAIKAFKAIDGKGFARVDFFVNDKTNEIYINEINTLPGFTEISMYPKLWAQSGLEYSELLDKLIDLALEN